MKTGVTHTKAEFILGILKCLTLIKFFKYFGKILTQERMTFSGK